MTSPHPLATEELLDLVEQLPHLKHGKYIQRALEAVIRMAGEEIDRLDWKILTASLEDLEKGFTTFYPYRHIRKITIFGSARTDVNSAEYEAAVEFARRITEIGFMVLTGAGGGIMQAGNEGAGRQHSFGLNIKLPFEQSANPYIDGDAKLVDFKYFFTRKLFFLRESDAVALFPGGFGTQDEAFETLTLSQTGRYGPCPLVLIDEPGGDYWKTWQEQIKENLHRRALISPDDIHLYTITDDIEKACEVVRNFYRVYHSSRFVGQMYVMRLNYPLSDGQLEELNEVFTDIIVTGKIERTKALPQEQGDKTEKLPRIIFNFDQQNYGRLYQLIGAVNNMEIEELMTEHPELK